MGWSAIAAFLLGVAQIRVLAFGLILDFPRLMMFGLGRRGVVASLANFRLDVLPALLDSAALVLYLSAMLFIHRLPRSRCWIRVLALGNHSWRNHEQSRQNHVDKPPEVFSHQLLLNLAQSLLSAGTPTQK